jgi:hypothetical protein
MPKAELVIHQKIRTTNGVVVEVKVWRVAKSVHFPEGFKYSFYAVLAGEVLVGYDNHAPKGHHRHIEGREDPYLFRGVDRLRDDFARDLAAALAEREE